MQTYQTINTPRGPMALIPVPVTPTHITVGQVDDACNCPLALAIHDALTLAGFILEDDAVIVGEFKPGEAVKWLEIEGIAPNGEKFRFSRPLTPSEERHGEEFDRDEDADPITTEVQIPASWMAPPPPVMQIPPPPAHPIGVCADCDGGGWVHVRDDDPEAYGATRREPCDCRHPHMAMEARSCRP